MVGHPLSLVGVDRKKERLNSNIRDNQNDGNNKGTPDRGLPSWNTVNNAWDVSWKVNKKTKRRNRKSRVHRPPIKKIKESVCPVVSGRYIDL